MERGFFQEEHIIFRDSFVKYLEKEVVPYYEQWEHDHNVRKRPGSRWEKTAFSALG